MILAYFLKNLKIFFVVLLMTLKSVCKSYTFQMQNGKLIQISDNMCPVDWDDDVFESMMKLLSKKMRVEVL